jgi:hypothetical protein
MQRQEIKMEEVKVHTPDLAKDKKNELTVTLFIGGQQVDSLTSEQSERMAKRLGKTMSLFYTAHSDEYEKI